MDDFDERLQTVAGLIDGLDKLIAEPTLTPAEVAKRKELRAEMQAALQTAMKIEWKAKSTRAVIESALAEMDKRIAE